MLCDRHQRQRLLPSCRLCETFGKATDRCVWTLRTPPTWSHSPQCAECDHVGGRVWVRPVRRRRLPKDCGIERGRFRRMPDGDRRTRRATSLLVCFTLLYFGGPYVPKDINQATGTDEARERVSGRSMLTPVAHSRRVGGNMRKPSWTQSTAARQSTAVRGGGRRLGKRVPRSRCRELSACCELDGPGPANSALQQICAILWRGLPVPGMTVRPGTFL